MPQPSTPVKKTRCAGYTVPNLLIGVKKEADGKTIFTVIETVILAKK